MEAVALIALALVIGIVIYQRQTEATDTQPEVTQVAAEPAEPVEATEATEATEDTEATKATEPEATTPPAPLPELPSSKALPPKVAPAESKQTIPRRVPAETPPHITPSAYNILGLGGQILFIDRETGTIAVFLGWDETKNAAPLFAKRILPALQ